MTIGAILPSLGLIPSGLTRPEVPRDLQPDISEPTENSGDQDRLLASSEDEEQTGLSQRGTSGAPIASNANPAVTLQVQQGQQQELDAVVDDEPIPGELTEEEEALVKELKAIDRQVRAHEQAHAAAGAGLTGAPEYEYVRGPDGVQYAVAGKVKIDTAQIPEDPEATIEKMEAVRAAALAPSRPSGQDRAVAAAAEQAIREAEAALRDDRTEERGAVFDETAEENGSSAAEDVAEGDTNDIASVSAPVSGGSDAQTDTETEEEDRDNPSSPSVLVNPFASRQAAEISTPISIDLIA